MRAIALFVLVLIASPSLVSAQLRAIPEDAIRATMQPPQNGLAKVGKYVFRLAPGAQIRSADNRIVLPVMVNAEQLDLRLNRQGLLKSLHDAMNRVADLSRLAT